jgi:hypothetical protein
MADLVICDDEALARNGPFAGEGRIGKAIPVLVRISPAEK